MSIWDENGNREGRRQEGRPARLANKKGGRRSDLLAEALILRTY